MLTKVCNVCALEKSIEEFYTNKRSKDGKQYRCKTCCAEYHKAHKDRASKQRKSYRERNPELLAQQKHQYYLRYKDTILQKQHRYYIDNKELVSKRIAGYKKENKDVVNADKAKRKALKKKATPSWSDYSTIKGMYELASLFNEVGVLMHVDHIVPLQSDSVCGLHCEANLQLLPASDNISKGNRWWPDMW